MIKLKPLTEAQEQQAVIAWAAHYQGLYPCLKWLHHIPNGGSRDKKEAVNLKRQGVKAGVSDLFLPCACHGYHGLYIEMKSKNGKLSKKQAEFIEDMIRQGYKAVVCYGAETAIKVIMQYINEGTQFVKN